MNGQKVLLFGLAVVCYSGFVLVARGVGVFQSGFYWGMHLGLGICALGFLFGEWRSDDGSSADAP